ncbi:MAG TPA: hypothetical protein DCE02_04815 [Ruminiclostridium sp.]|uniref:Uncharacterized protein n=1 Tax=Acetivibrio saccincola TaxID=1677857 RepID=A0A2S8RB73_9FIRM|nr:hypothetical protein B9R14_10015 [Acetivibrio saccincola]HAA43309.1 hypothetical protein [Ruminiclostridium sp.]
MRTFLKGRFFYFIVFFIVFCVRDMVNILFIFTLTKVKEAGDSWLKGVVIIQNGVFLCEVMKII